MITAGALSTYGRATPGLSTQGLEGGLVGEGWKVASAVIKQTPKHIEHLTLLLTEFDHSLQSATFGNLSVLSAAFTLTKTCRYHYLQTSAVDELFEEREIANDASLAIEALAFNRAVPHRELISSRLRELLQEFASENEGKTFSGPSVRGLTSFLVSNRFIKRPALSVTDGGLVYARWRHDANSIFSVQFMSERLAEFVLFTPVEGGRGTRTAIDAPERIGDIAALPTLAWVRA